MYRMCMQHKLLFQMHSTYDKLGARALPQISVLIGKLRRTNIAQKNWMDVKATGSKLEEDQDIYTIRRYLTICYLQITNKKMSASERRNTADILLTNNQSQYHSNRTQWHQVSLNSKNSHLFIMWFTNENGKSESNQMENLINSNKKILQINCSILFKVSVCNSSRVNETRNNFRVETNLAVKYQSILIDYNIKEIKCTMWEEPPLESLIKNSLFKNFM